MKRGRRVMPRGHATGTQLNATKLSSFDVSRAAFLRQYRGFCQLETPYLRGIRDAASFDNWAGIASNFVNGPTPTISSRRSCLPRVQPIRGENGFVPPG